jgi:glutathione synthase/RimK-type ligase-like ATP-grasp enzyme
VITSPAGSRIALLLEASGSDSGVPRVSVVLDDLITRLRQHGARVALIVPANEPLDIAHVQPSHDLYVVCEPTALILSVAAALTITGASVVNTARSCALATDKVAATPILAAGGVPVPASWTTGRPAWLASLLAESPLWLMPQRAARSLDRIHLANAESLPGNEATADIYGLPRALFAQREIPSDSRDIRVFVVGDEMWAVARSVHTRGIEERPRTPIVPRPEIRDAARACGTRLGLELYSVDVVDTGEEYFVVDVDPCPAYEGVTAAARVLAEYLQRKARPSRE